ncbi:hypothetical protein CRX72_17590 [Pantoea sp. BRM17]|nr:hypothetical protein CRX72_17590 [Pantoea sp. BRM17]
MQPVSAQSVLIVDDALTWRKLLAGLLRQWGYHVLEAEEGEQALALLRQHPVNLLSTSSSAPPRSGIRTPASSSRGTEITATALAMPAIRLARSRCSTATIAVPAFPAEAVRMQSFVKAR